jgi:hypothetical protein
METSANANLRRPGDLLEAVVPVPDDLAPVSRQVVLARRVLVDITAAKVASHLGQNKKILKYFSPKIKPK